MPVAVAKTLTRQPYWTGVPDVPGGLAFDVRKAAVVVARWQVVFVGAASVLVACTRMVGGVAQLPATEAPGPTPPAGINVGEIVLDTASMRGIAGAGEDLTIIPSMDTTSPVDIAPLADSAPDQCRFVFAETATFGPDLRRFHKTTFQYPPKGALISEAAAAYLDAGTARQAFDTLVATVDGCTKGSFGARFVGTWRADEQALHTRAGRCGRDYRLKSAVLLEVTYCGFPESVPDIVLTNMATNVPG